MTKKQDFKLRKLIREQLKKQLKINSKNELFENKVRKYIREAIKKQLNENTTFYLTNRDTSYKLVWDKDIAILSDKYGKEKVYDNIMQKKQIEDIAKKLKMRITTKDIMGYFS